MPKKSERDRLEKRAREAAQKSPQKAQELLWLSFQVPRLLHYQYRLWCKLEGWEPEKRMAAILFDAMASHDRGRLHLEAMGPHTRFWRDLAAKAGWKLTEKGQLRKKR